MTASALLLLGLLQIKHLFADFFWQTGWMVHHKHRYFHPAGLVHSGLHVFCSFIVLWVFLPDLPLGVVMSLVFAEFLAHFHIDWAKATIVKRIGCGEREKGFWNLMGVDQTLHHLTYLGMVWVVFAASGP